MSIERWIPASKKSSHNPPGLFAGLSPRKQMPRMTCWLVPKCALVAIVPCEIMARCSTRAGPVLPGKDMDVERAGSIALEIPWLHPVSNKLIATIYRWYSRGRDGSEVAERLHASKEFGLYQPPCITALADYCFAGLLGVSDGLKAKYKRMRRKRETCRQYVALPLLR